MATATAAARRDKIKDYTFVWEGKDKAGKVLEARKYLSVSSSPP